MPSWFGTKTPKKPMWALMTIEAHALSTILEVCVEGETTWGEIESAVVTLVTPYGARARTDDGTEAPIALMQITHGRLRHPEDVLEVGDPIDVRRTTLDGRIQFSRKAALPEPFEAFARQHLAGTIVEAEIVSIERTPDGSWRVIAELAPGVEGSTVHATSGGPPWQVGTLHRFAIDALDLTQPSITLSFR